MLMRLAFCGSCRAERRVLRRSVTVRVTALTAMGAVLVACGASRWTPDQGYDIRLVNSTSSSITVKFCGNGGAGSCTVEATVEPGACSEALRVDSVSAEAGRAAVFEIVGSEQANGYIAVKPSGNDQAFDVAPRWPDAVKALTSPAATVASGCA